MSWLDSKIIYLGAVLSSVISVLGFIHLFLVQSKNEIKSMNNSWKEMQEKQTAIIINDSIIQYPMLFDTLSSTTTLPVIRKVLIPINPR